MRKFSTLVLTNHLTHVSYDSIYGLFDCISNSNWCKELHIVSQGLKQNENFFNNPLKYQYWAREYDNSLNFDSRDEWFKKSDKILNLSVDIIFLRLDVPIKKEFLKMLKNTFINTLFINEPNGILQSSSKEYLLNFLEYTPYTKIASSFDEVLDETKKRDLVIKPILGYGGHGILRITSNKYFIGNKECSFEAIKNEINLNLKKQKKVLLMEYLPRVNEGDKRVLVVNGHVVGAILRIPAKDSWVCNLKQGGSSVSTTISNEEYEIAKSLSESLKKIGVVIFGFDTLVNNKGKRILSEINTTNVGGFLQVKKSQNKNIFKDLSEFLGDYIYNYYRNNHNL